jgi:hypothetical protein
MLLNDNKISKGSMQVSVKDAQVPLKKTITWAKDLGKGGKNGKRFALKLGCNFEN